MINRYFVFVYIKDEKVKVLSYDDALIFDKTDECKRWELTATLDPCMFIKYLCDQKETDMQLMAIKSLTNVGANKD